jgi:hypothetical protein
MWFPTLYLRFSKWGCVQVFVIANWKFAGFGVGVLRSPVSVSWVWMCTVYVSGWLPGFLAADWSAPLQIGTLNPPSCQEVQLSAINDSFCSLKSQCSFIRRELL